MKMKILPIVKIGECILTCTMMFIANVASQRHGSFFASSRLDVHENEIVTEYKVNSHFQCLHRCKLDSSCEDIAMKGKNICLLLTKQKETTAPVLDDTKRITPTSISTSIYDIIKF